MRVEVIRAFVDKETGQGYNVGDTYETQDDTRIAELYKGGFVAKPPESPYRSVRVHVDDSADAPASAKRMTRRTKAVKTDESDK